jgi:antitoxin MazE
MHVYNVDTGGNMIVHAKIQKWGNGLALRIGGVVREIPRLKEGTEVDIEVTDEGFTVRKAARKNVFFPFTESQLLDGLTEQTAQVDLLAIPTSKEVES